MKFKERFSTERLKERDEKRRKGGRFNRVGAYIIDHFIQGAVSSIVVTLVWMVFFFTKQVPQTDAVNVYALPLFFQFPTILLLIFSGFFYQVLLPFFFLDGQTFGKRLIGLKVVKVDESKAGFTNYVLRYLAMMVEGFPNFSFIGQINVLAYTYLTGNAQAPWVNQVFGGIFALSVLWALIQKERRSLHDYVGGTKVIPVTPHDMVDYNRPISKDIDLSNI